MGVDLEEDIKRRPVELNVRAARKRQSPQTGFVHHCYEAQGESHDTIPLFENFCFAYALLRSRQSENVLEAQELLRKLLCFASEGNFPVYLHEFPLCRDRLLSLSLLPLFEGILCDFEAVIGETLRASLLQLIDTIVCNSYLLLSEGKVPFMYECLLKAYAEPQWNPDVTLGQEITPLLMALPMAQRRKAVWVGGLCHLLLKQWHPLLLTALAVQEQEREEPRCTLFDLFMSDYYRSYPQRLLVDHPVHLRASLVHTLCLPQSPQSNWSIPYQTFSSHPRQPYALYWGSASHLHTLVCETKKNSCQIELLPQGAVFTYVLPASDEESEMAFFCNAHPEHALFVSGRKATAFALHECLEIRSGAHVFALRFSLEEGEGVFFGHLSRANRPLQIAARGEKRYAAYDWQIALRSIRRAKPCVLKVFLTYSQ